MIPLGLASGAWNEALSGAALALILTVALVAVLYTYLVKVPDVFLTLGAVLLLLFYGTFWLRRRIGFSVADRGFSAASFDWWLQSARYFGNPSAASQVIYWFIVCSRSFIVKTARSIG